MAQFIEPPPTVIAEFNYVWREWLRKLYDNIKETEEETTGTFSNAFLTGMMVPRMGSTTPPDGWILHDDGTIGGGTSGASNRANDDTFNLFTSLWDNYSDALAPVSTGRGASAADDFAAGKTLNLPLAESRVIGVAGSGSGLTTRSNGAKVGEETHVLSAAETGLRAHTHPLQIFDKTGGSNTKDTTDSTTVSQAIAENTDVNTQASGAAHNVMQPTAFYPWLIKL
jgi:hypothetical protein